MKSKNIDFIAPLDHLRCFAALLVIFYHGLHLIGQHILYDGPFSFEHWFYANEPFSAFIIEGHTAVAFFLVLSGFIFTVGAYQKNIVYRQYIRNRLLRIYPLFLIYIFIGISAHPESFDFIGFVQTLAGLANASNALNVPPYSSMFWAVAIEWQFYLLFPLLLLLLNKNGVGALVGLILVACVFRSMAYLEGANPRDLSYWTMAGRIDQFLIGMIAGVFYRHREPLGPSWKYLFPLAGMGLLAMTYAFNKLGGWPLVHWFKLFWPTAEALVWAFFILCYIAFSTIIPRWIARILTALGTISYSIYLVHMIVIEIVLRKNWLLQIGAIPERIAVVNTLLVVLPLVLVISALTYRFVEKPFLEMRVRYANTDDK